MCWGTSSGRFASWRGSSETRRTDSEKFWIFGSLAAQNLDCLGLCIVLIFDFSNGCLFKDIYIYIHIHLVDLQGVFTWYYSTNLKQWLQQHLQSHNFFKKDSSFMENSTSITCVRQSFVGGDSCTARSAWLGKKRLSSCSSPWLRVS